MQAQRPREITVKVGDVRELFAARAFDPFADEPEGLESIAEMARLPHLVSKLDSIRLRVLVPASGLTPQTEPMVRRALQRYCGHAIAEARRKLAALRWVGLRTFAVGLAFFGISLAASTAVNRMLFIPDALRTLASESFIVAGWVLLWQPLDTLVSGWWPHWEEERTFRAIGAIPIDVSGY
jgi:hypothetical protein